MLGNGTVTACSNGSCLQVRTKWLRSIFKAIILPVNHMIIRVRRYFIKMTILPYKQLRYFYLTSEMNLEFPISICKYCVYFCLPKLCILQNVLIWGSWLYHRCLLTFLLVIQQFILNVDVLYLRYISSMVSFQGYLLLFIDLKFRKILWRNNSVVREWCRNAPGKK